MINVFFPYYDCGETMRQAEIDLCLKENVENSHINNLFVVVDDGSIPPYTGEKTQVLYVDKRMTYKYWIELTKEFCDSGISILCNSDIYFDDSLSRLEQIMSSPYSFLALSRWELIDNKITKHPNPHWSQDTWAINVTDVLSNSLMKQLDFSMGVPRCDNKVAYLFATFGWNVFNPIDHVKSIHAHETQLRTYHKKMDERILGGVAYVHPGENATDKASLDFDIWVKRADVNVNLVKVNRTLERWQKEARAEASNNEEIVVSLDSVSASVLLEAAKNGTREIVSEPYFHLLYYQSRVFFHNLLASDHLFSSSEEEYGKAKSYCNVAGFIPAVIDTYVKEIGEKAKLKDDINFWQYPCATEKRAYQNHCSRSGVSHIDLENKLVNVYLPVPWATYVDKKRFPDDYLDKLSKVIANYRSFATTNGFTLRVHSVCQHIHWIRVLEKAEWLGVTDLYLSHKDSKSEAIQEEIGTNLKLHGWTLIAVNYETHERKEGMERKPAIDRKLLASFIGAHMPHYRDNSRIRLFEAAKECMREDVFVDLGNEWHFNKVVYEEQVLNKEIESHHIDEHHKRTFRYNSILSDSKFSLCPEGAGPNTLRFWESIAVGSIPVLFSSDLSIFKDSDICSEILSSAIIWDKAIDANLFRFLDELTDEDIDKRMSVLTACYEVVKNMECF